MSDNDDLERELLESTERGLRQAEASQGDTRREALGGAVRALTRLWSEVNPGFPREAWGQVSWMLEENWDRIVAHHHNAQNLDPHDSVAPGTRHRTPPASEAAGVVRGHCDALASEPLFGARELIHSNLLAWYLDHEPAVQEALRGWTTWANNAWAPTQREHRKFDLVVHLADCEPLVIENKTFSFPNRVQLEAYTAKAGTASLANASLVLLSLAEPGWKERETEIGGRRWRYRSYAELGTALEHAAGNIDRSDTDGAYRAETLRRYAGVLQRLHAIADIVTDLDQDSRYALPKELADELTPVRLDASYQKIRAYRVYTLLRDEIPGIIVDFTHRDPLLEHFKPVPGTDDEIGWQMQGAQWRLAVRVGAVDHGHGTGEANAERRATYVEDRYEPFFDLASLGADVLPVTSKKSWLNFAPGFVYRYARLPAGTTVGRLLELHHQTDTLAGQYLHR